MHPLQEWRCNCCLAVLHQVRLDETCAYRDVVLILLSPGDSGGKKRLAALQQLLRGDLRLRRVEIYVRGGASTFNLLNLLQWATDVACYLVPGAIKIFQRNRWCKPS